MPSAHCSYEEIEALCQELRENQNHCDKQRPAGRCCFYCRFVCFNVILLHSMKNSHIYQCKAAHKIRQRAFQDMKDADLTLPADSDIIELPERR